ncbi:DedA family protein [Frigidibacter sp. MR17.14]|uniref:DedA family protein n=1 Tax=Frigidibacter sp. MR17.14 TaxID=3126509 RepID=UPI0030131684
MLTTVMATLAGWITAAIAASGYGGVALLMALESACIPLPSEIIMPFAGSLVASGRLDLWMVATAGALGCNLGSTVAWLVGSRGGRAVVLRWGRRVGLSERSLARSEAHFARWGTATVFTSRLLPVVRTFISLPAGIARMPFWRFQIYTFLGSWPWCLALAWIGMRLGEAWDRTPALHSAMHAFDAVVVLGLAGWLGWVLLRRRRDRA